MKNGELEGSGVVELAEVDSGVFEHVAEQGVDRHGRVGMGSAPHAHFEEDGGADERGGLTGSWIGDLVGAMPVGLAFPDPSRRTPDTSGRTVGHGLHELVVGATPSLAGQYEDVDVLGEALPARPSPTEVESLDVGNVRSGLFVIRVVE